MLPVNKELTDLAQMNQLMLLKVVLIMSINELSKELRAWGSMRPDIFVISRPKKQFKYEIFIELVSSEIEKSPALKDRGMGRICQNESLIG